jgi:thiamine biosynthesis lipoprotein
MNRLEFRAVGTTCSAVVTDGGGAQRALEAARAEVESCESALSRFRTDSDLSRLNAADGRWVVVDERLREALALALRAREATNGRFDPTVLPALTAAGYDRSFEQLEEREPRAAAGWSAGARIDVDGDRIRLERGAAVDLGGIGKGYAAERAVAANREAWPAAQGAGVDLGGDLALWGVPEPGTPWRVRVADPRGGSAGTIVVHGGGFATSGRDVRRFGPRRSLHHLIDPATGAPAEPGPLAVTVVAARAAEAEAHSTALAISTLSAAREHVAATPGIAALWIPEHGAPLPLGPLPLGGSRIVMRAAA